MVMIIMIIMYTIQESCSLSVPTNTRRSDDADKPARHIYSSVKVDNVVIVSCLCATLKSGSEVIESGTIR